jgi:type I restriction enzyme, S subunit
MGKYQGYKKYKDSGVEWLGKIPEHWETMKIQHVGRLKSGENIVSQQIEKEGLYPVFGGNGLRGYFDSYTHDGHYILIGRQGALCGNINYGNGRFWASEHAVVVLPSVKFHVCWLGGLLETMNLNQYSTSAAQPGLSAEQIGRLKIPFPPLDEQELIAHFLDRKISQIDTLIAKKEALLEKLDEKRTALISHAVTKGLDRTVPMKDSGVEWLGDIPEHWEVSRIGFIANIGNGSTPNRSNESFWDQGSIPWLNSSKVNEKVIYYASQFVTEEAVNQCHLPIVQPDSIVLAITGEGKTRGNVAICKIHTTINQHLAYISPFTKRVSLHFLFLYLQAMYEKIRTDSAGNGSTKGAITCQEIKGYKLPLPTIEEQEKIVYFLDNKTDEIDQQKAKVKEAIALLKEYRAALITNAVTGKIDVRQVEE